jgi:4-amino-4-deoxy-L-arabinose transferase-like glycosyltransferase
MFKSNHQSLFKVFLSFEALALLLRWPSFFSSVMDHDESTYIVIADAIRNGGMYFTDVIDNKPIGIFLLFAFFQKLFGSSIIIIRILAATWVAMTASSLFLLHRRMGSSPSAGRASGLMFVFMTSIFMHFGLSPNTEIFYVFFTTAAFAIVAMNQSTIQSLFAGILLGAGFLIKYVVAFDALAIGIIMIISLWHKGLWTVIRTGAMMVIGFTIPLAALFFYYQQAGKLDSLMYYTFELSYKYVSGRGEGNYFVFFGDLLGRFFPVTCWFFLVISPIGKANRIVKLSGIIWFLAAAIAIILQGKFFYHYFIQLMPPLVFVAGSFFDERQTHGRFWSKVFQRKTGGVALIALGVLNVGIQVQQVLLKEDYPKEVAAWLNKHLQPGDALYTGNYHQIVYHLTDKNSPTPYVHSSLLTNEKHLFVQGISHEQEMKKILNQQPAYIVIEKEYPVKSSPIHEALKNKYQLVKTFGDDIKIYERRGD